MKPTLYILCGYPFSGKSTLARKIEEQKNNFKHLCVDNLHKEIHFKKIKHEEERWKESFKKAFNLTRKYLEGNINVIFDATNYLKKERDKLRKLAKESGAKSKVIYVDIPKKEARRRLIENRETKNRKDVSESDWKEVTEAFEVPTKDENVITYRLSQDTFNWIDENIK